MIKITEEQAEALCDHYCRFPYAIEGDDLESICDKCPLNGCGWITDDLPPKTGAYLVTCKNGNVKVGHFSTFDNTWTDARAIAWMYLPEEYQEDKK